MKREHPKWFERILNAAMRDDRCNGNTKNWWLRCVRLEINKYDAQ